MNTATLLESIDLSPTLLEDRAAYLKAVRQGISGRLLKEIVRVFGERELLIKLLNTSSANLNRFYKAEPLSSFQSESVLDLLKIFNLTMDVFGDEEKAKIWLHSNVFALNGECPIDLCDTFEGRSLVKECLQAIDYGEFV
jgi:putative toxin-antitoxin system antitoxin component (TIGR02293 family)